MPRFKPVVKSGFIHRRSKEISFGDRWVDGAYRRPVDERAGVRRIGRIDRLVQAATGGHVGPQPVIQRGKSEPSR